MNKTYGIRIKAAFESDQRWYDINAYGGRQLAIWSWLLIGAGVTGFFISPAHFDAYAGGSRGAAIMELGFIAKVSTNYQSVVTQGQPVILKIVVSEIAPANRKSQSGTDSP